MEGLSANEGIVYSTLVYKSLSNPEYFDAEGNFCLGMATAYIEDKLAIEGTENIPKSNISLHKLAKEVEMSRDSVRRILASLRQKKLTGGDFIICPIAMLLENYLTLPNKTYLKGQQLLFYAYLKNRSLPYHGVIDTWASKLADDCNISKRNAYAILHILHEKGFVERLDSGNLMVK